MGRNKNNVDRGPLAPSIVSNDSDLDGRQKIALELRLRGYSFPAIAKHMGIKHSFDAYHLVEKALTIAREHHKHASGNILQLELDRIDRMLSGLEKKIFPPDEVDAEFEGCLSCMRMASVFIDQKARLLGLYAPEQAAAKAPLPWVDD